MVKEQQGITLTRTLVLAVALLMALTEAKGTSSFQHQSLLAEVSKNELYLISWKVHQIYFYPLSLLLQGIM